MSVRTGTERAESLVIELAARTAIIDGARIELPPTEFDLLAAFAARPGEIVTHKEIATIAFGEGVSVAPHELHWRIWKVRDVIGDSQREHKLIENRRGVGYVLDLPPSAVEVREGVLSPPPEERAIRLEPTESDESAATAQEVAALPAESPKEPSSRRRPRRLRSGVVLTATVISVIALAAAWTTGYLISKQKALPAVDSRSNGASSAPGQRDQRTQQRQSGRHKQEGAAKKDRRSGSKESGPRVPSALIAAPADSSNTRVNEGVRRPGRQRAQRSGEQTGSQEPELATAPEGYLYHLVNRKSGDHFVTTSAEKADEYRGKGYEGGAIARVYTYAERRVETKSITLNVGTAYVFSSASPETKPRIMTLKLWYASDGQGDFFYTTNATEASADGWDAALVGYVRSV